MFRRLSLRLCSATLANGTQLRGELNPANRNLLLKGVATLPDGRVFSGSFDPVKGFPLPGSRLEEDGDLYRGSFNEQWQRDGNGEAWLTDGTHYQGKFHEDELVEGVVRIPNGTTEAIFKGTLRDEEFVRGRLAQQDFVYEGEFASNQPQGRGRLTFTTGGEQEGTFFAGKLHGKNCKMKLDGGFVYVGEFMDGKIRNGMLYSPTYTYEGEFNEHGRAHGEGSQTYLTNEPRLTFSGIWNNGALVRGMCVDEYGSPVDWQNNNDIQAKVFGGATGDDGSVAVNSYCSAKLKEADTLHRDMEKSYMEDAETVSQETGKYPSKMDLGYEGSIAQENAAVQEAGRKQMEDINRSKETLVERGMEFQSVASQAAGNIVGELNESMAKIQFSRQVGAEQLSAQRIDEQFERFMKTFDRPTKKLSTESHDMEAEEVLVSEKASTKLNIDGNAPWKSFTP